MEEPFCKSAWLFDMRAFGFCMDACRAVVLLKDVLKSLPLDIRDSISIDYAVVFPKGWGSE